MLQLQRLLQLGERLFASAQFPEWVGDSGVRVVISGVPVAGVVSPLQHRPSARLDRSYWVGFSEKSGKVEIAIIQLEQICIGIRRRDFPRELQGFPSVWKGPVGFSQIQLDRISKRNSYVIVVAHQATTDMLHCQLVIRIALQVGLSSPYSPYRSLQGPGEIPHET